MCSQFWVCFTAVRTEGEMKEERQSGKETKKEGRGVSVIETRSTCQKNELTITQN